MPTVTELIREHCLRNLPPVKRMPSLDSLLRSERNPEFERLRMNRKIIGAFRYGLMGSEGKKKFDRVRDMVRRLNEYLSDKNKEHLVDVANLCELEFVEGDGKWNPQDDGEHVKVIE